MMTDDLSRVSTSWPVIHQRTEIGTATCEKGAKAVAARRIGGLLSFERWTARLADRYEGDDYINSVGKAWFVAPQMKGRR